MCDIIKMEGETNRVFNVVESIPEWQSHFDKHCIEAGSFEIPRPFMLKGFMDKGYVVSCDKSRIPVLAGGLCPYGEKYFEIGKVWVYILGRTKEHRCVGQSLIDDPTLEEYKKHFKKDVETFKYFIENKMNKAIDEEISRVSVR